MFRASRGLFAGLGKSKAPHFLVLSGPSDEQMHVNAGFAGESLVVGLTARGLATCRLGGHINADSLARIVPGRETCVPAAMIAFGYPAGPDKHLRTDPGKTSRKPLSSLLLNSSSDSDWAPLLETARLAPSAVNRQPWRFKFDKGFLHCYILNPSFIVSRKLLGNLSFVDAGIMLCHIAEAAAHHNRKIFFERVPHAQVENLSYITSVGRENS